MNRLLRGLDNAGWLRRLLSYFRRTLPSRRGLLLLGGVALTVLSLLVHILYLISDTNPLIGLCGFLLLHIAIIVGFIGVLLAEALGRGYRD